MLFGQYTPRHLTTGIHSDTHCELLSLSGKHHSRHLHKPGWLLGDRISWATVSPSSITDRCSYVAQGCTTEQLKLLRKTHPSGSSRISEQCFSNSAPLTFWARLSFAVESCLVHLYDDRQLPGLYSPHVNSNQPAETRKMSQMLLRYIANQPRLRTTASETKLKS